MTHRVFKLLVVALAVAGFRQAAQAQINWNVANGDFNTGTNWDAGIVPGLFDVAMINNGGTSNYTSGSAFIDALVVGSSAGNSGAFNLTGGQLSPSKAVFGEGGSATATLNGGTLDALGSGIFVGGTEDGITSGVGELNVIGGPSTVFKSADDVIFGRNGTGTLNMSGGWGSGGYTVVGKFGSATWNHSGGVFDQDFGDIEIGDGGRPDQAGVPGPREGTINLTGGVIQASGHVAIGNRNGTGTVNISGGALAVTGDGNGTGTIFVGRGMDWTAGTGGATFLRVTGDDAIIVANGGLDMNSSGVASSSTLIAEITGPAHSPIKVVGDANIAGGAFKVELNGYTPSSGDSWVIVEAGADVSAELTAIDAQVSGGGYPALTHVPGSALGALMGTFLSTDFAMAPLAPGLSWDVSYMSNKVTLSVTGMAQFAADFNHDGKVDGADLGVWEGAFGMTAAGDADGDLDSDGADFLVWQQQLGSGGPAVAAAGAIPEPSAAVLALVGAALAVGARRQRHCTL